MADTKNTPHYWIKKHFGRADHCDVCGKTEEKNKKTHFDWSHKTHEYSKDLSQWWQLCRSCHQKYDYHFNGVRTNRGVRSKQAETTPQEARDALIAFLWLTKVHPKDIAAILGISRPLVLHVLKSLKS